MSTLWVACVLTVVFMIAQDFLGTGLVIAESRNLSWYPGTFDAMGDFFNRAGAALSAGSYVAHGLFAWQTLLLLGATMLTSFCTTNVSTPVMSKLLPTQRQAGDRKLHNNHISHVVARLEEIERAVGLGVTQVS